MSDIYVRPRGIEPLTFSMSTKRSTTELRAQIIYFTYYSSYKDYKKQTNKSIKNKNRKIKNFLIIYF